MQSLMKSRYLQFAGPVYQVGYALGSILRQTLASEIEHYLKNGPLKFGDLSLTAIEAGAMSWFESLPERFQQEMQGMADGSGVPLERISAWGYADAGGRKACSGFLLKAGGNLWVGRNNDLWVPDLWGYVIERHIEGRLSTLSFGMRGEIFAATGLNEVGLWLHYNWLPAFDRPAEQAWTPYVLMTEILETCRSIDEMETVLNNTQRTGGMMVFAAQMENGAALFECAPKMAIRINLTGSFLAGSNHYQRLATPQLPEDYASNSLKRLEALHRQLTALPKQPSSQDLIAVLADPDVEQHQADYGTVYSNLVCLTQHELWFTFGGFPAASRGNWQKMPWPW